MKFLFGVLVGWLFSEDLVIYSCVSLIGQLVERLIEAGMLHIKPRVAGGLEIGVGVVVGTGMFVVGGVNVS